MAAGLHISNRITFSRVPIWKASRCPGSFRADRAGAITVEVDASHVVMMSQPQVVADLIRSALGSLA